jgi:hypothetical protein
MRREETGRKRESATARRAQLREDKAALTLDFRTSGASSYLGVPHISQDTNEGRLL